MNNMNKLYTYINTYNSLKYLNIYLEKILNNRSTRLKYIEDFDILSLDLLYTAIKYTLIDEYDISKLDTKELNYYIKKTSNISYFTKQNKNIKTIQHLIKYLIDNLKDGSYHYMIDNTITIGNVLVKIDWLTNITNFLINSFLLEEFISDDRKLFTYKVLEPNQNINDSIVYEYQVSKIKKTKLSYNEILFIYDTLAPINKYSFNNLKDLNSMLTKEGYILSINKIKISNTKLDKDYLSKLSKDGKIEYINSSLLISNRKVILEKINNNQNYELLRSLSHAYKDRISLNKCRKLIKDNNNLMLTYYFSIYYLNYSYDYQNLNKYYNYEQLKTAYLRPIIIDYNSNEYRTTMNKLSSLSKSIVKQNKIVNKHLTNNFKNMKVLKDNSHKLTNSCNKLYTLVKSKEILKAKLDILEDDNKRSKKTLINYLSKSLYSYNYKIDNELISFKLQNNKQIIFLMNITKNSFKEFLKNEDNINLRISFYEKR